MKNLVRLLIGVVVFALLLGVYTAKDPNAAQSDPTESDAASVGPEASMAVIIAQDKVKEQLKSPSTADFEMFNGEATDKGNGLFVVRDHVDSQNGFGATIRSEYSVELQFNGGDQADPSSWTVNSIVIQ
ncbi:hypothetical protein [Hymenobacter sediminicola]|uniref:Uncharacterized protein n=1 Tax=Hymenobacter sediminicola TaxID=2761579 RepID=A0A7G7W2Z2_9BACT|nr:hypothetical protein [Hymenobacter sediminicola]QNH60735.1 hypothetical protein H4317_11085 [Hymenobacter sediminicola]